MRSSKSSWLIPFLAVLVLLVAGCAPAAAPSKPSAIETTPPKVTPKEQPRPGGMLNIAWRVTPEHLDFHQAAVAPGLWATGPTYSSLVRYDWAHNEKIIQDLAEKWEVSQDGKLYTFNLRRGVKWHDGKPFTSADVKFSLDRIRKPPQGVTSPRQTLLQSIKEIEAPDDFTIKITTDYADASLIGTIASPWNGIMPKHVIEQKGDMKTIVVGTGPFKFKGYSPGVSFEVVKNPDYFLKGLPYLDGITRYVLLDSAKRSAAFRAGQVDIVDYGSFTPTDAEQLAKELPQVRVVDQPGVCWTSLYFNTERKPWDDVRVRRAVHLAYDRQLHLKIALEARGDVGWVIPRTSMYAIQQAELEKVPGFRQPKDADMVEAKKLLAQVGLPSGFTADLLWRTGTTYEPAATFADNQLRKLGIGAKLRSLETAAFVEAGAKGTFDLYTMYRCTLLSDPNDPLRSFVSGDAFNYSRYKDPDIDQLFKEQSRTLDTAKRKEIVLQIQRKLLETVPAIVLGWHAHIMGWYPKVKDYVPGLNVYNNLDFYVVWLGQ